VALIQQGAESIL